MPEQFNLDYEMIYNKGYEEGYEEGHEVGYQKGYTYNANPRIVDKLAKIDKKFNDIIGLIQVNVDVLRANIIKELDNERKENT